MWPGKVAWFRLFAIGLFLVLLWHFVGGRESVHWISRVSSLFGSCASGSPLWMSGVGDLARELDIPGAQVAYTDADGVTFTCEAGWSRHFPWPMLVRSDTQFRLASLSKIFTSVLSIREISEEKFELETPWVDLVDVHEEMADPRISLISIRNLLSHTSGFGSELSGWDFILGRGWCPDNLDGISHAVLSHDPGTYYEYSNFGYCLIGVALSRVEHMAVVDLYNKKIFEPMGFKYFYAANALGEQLPLVNDYIASSESFSLDEIPPYDASAFGGWVGVAKEMSWFLYSVKVGRILDKKSREVLFSVGDACDLSIWRACHGLGFYPYKREGREVMWWRDGSLPGATAFAAVFEDGSSFVFLGNSRVPDWKPAIERIGNWVYSNKFGRTSH